jgi:hypothetical protein
LEKKMNINVGKWAGRALYGAVGLAIGVVGYQLVANEILYGKLDRQREIGQTLIQLEEKGAKTCEELYGRVAVSAPELLEACKEGSRGTIHDAKIALNAL